MDRLQQQVRLALRRLTIQQFLYSLPRWWFALLVAAAVAVVVPKVVPLGLDSFLWTWGWIGGALGLGLLGAAASTLLRRRALLDAAIEIDLRFGLKERVSSALALAPAELETEAGRALLADASRRIEAIDVGEQFTVGVGRKFWLPLLPAAAAFLLAALVQDKALENPAEATPAVAVSEQVKRSTELLRRKVAEKREQAEEKGLKDAEDLFKKLEDGTRQLADGKDVDRQKALVKLNDLARELEKRRASVSTGERLQQQLGQMKNIERGPADRLADALRKGDMRKALEELKKLQDELKNEGLDQQAQEQLARQLEQMRDKLEQVADAHQKAMDALQEQVKQAQDAGDKAKADQLQQQLDKLAQQAPDMDKLKQMGDQLGQACESLKQGQADQAAAALDQLAGDLKGMQQEMEELGMLDDMLDQIAQAKDSMGCEQCAGGGCKECDGGLGGMAGMKGQGAGDGDGDGLGEGQGHGARPEEKTETAAYDSRVRQKIGQGAAVVTDLVDGPSVKGQVLEEVKNEIEASRRQSADPLTGERLPRTHRDHAREYFDAFRRGE